MNETPKGMPTDFAFDPFQVAAVLTATTEADFAGWVDADKNLFTDDIKQTLRQIAIAQRITALLMLNAANIQRQMMAAQRNRKIVSPLEN